MDRMIVTIFNDEKSAYEGMNALRELHSEGSLTLYGAAVLAKDLQGQVSVKQVEDEGPLGTLLGIMTGSLVGLLGGPVGLAAGATAGALTGSLYDLAKVGVSEDFLAEVTRNLTPGKLAVVADVNEEWVAPVDIRMEALGGVVFRRARAEFIDAQIEREIAADEAELAKLRAETDKAVGESKAKLQAKLDAAENKFEARRAVLNQRIDAVESEAEARIKSLQEQAARAGGEMKANLEQRVTRARADQKARVEKLRQAWRLVKEAAWM